MYALNENMAAIRCIGSTVLGMAYVAAGRFDAFFQHIKPCSWDIAAGALMVQEAGGRCTDILGNEYNLRTRNLIASNGKIGGFMGVTSGDPIKQKKQLLAKEGVININEHRYAFPKHS